MNWSTTQMAFWCGCACGAAGIAFAGYVWMCVCDWLAGRKQETRWLK